MTIATKEPKTLKLDGEFWSENSEVAGYFSYTLSVLIDLQTT